MIALVMALSMCAAMAGCGGSEGTGSTSDSSSAAEKTDSAPAESAEKEVPDSNEADAADDGTLAPEYTYYEELAEAWENDPKTQFSMASTYARIADNGNIYIYLNLTYIPERSLFSYNPETKETKLVCSDVPMNGRFWYANGYFYTFSNQCFKKMDANGSLVLTSENLNNNDKMIDADNSGAAVTDDGKIIYPYHEGNDKKIGMLSSDLQTITEIPNPQKEVEHGLTEETKVKKILGTYNGKMIAYSEVKDEHLIWMLDTDTLEWKLVTENFSVGSRSQIVGNFLIAENQILNLESGEIISVAQSLKTVDAGGPSKMNFALGYAGGTYSTIFDEKTSTWFRGRLANGTGSVEKGEALPDLEDELFDNDHTGIIYSVSDTQYVMIDEYGIFLRTYEGGAEGEETIHIFEN